MPRAKLTEIIGNFQVEKFTSFFRLKTQSQGNFRMSEEKLTNYNDVDFSVIAKLGQIEFSEIEKLIIVSAKITKGLSERSGKKAQYKKAKKILKDQQIFFAGIFIFYDDSGNFRFSLIYPESIGAHRQWSNFRRFTYFVSSEFTNKTFLQRIGDGDFSTFAKIKDAFSVEKVTKEFYESIANWYFWAVEHCQFPKDAGAGENDRKTSVIRLITRIIFIWFMRERGLVPKNLFEEKNIVSILKSISAKDSTYYMAILQNLFFATLNTKRNERKFRSEIRGRKGINPDYGNDSVFRYHKLFKSPKNLKNYFDEIPFLNGGLFECLDDRKKGIYIDGFTDVKKNQPNVPNFLFFSQEEKIDRSKAYGANSKTYKVRGLLDILSSFNFTIDENSPDDSDIALDPELLGRVFENLLASFNPETSTTARKATGSYYTPREIVDYMVAESLKAYFKTHLSAISDLDKKIDQLFSKGSEESPFDKSESKKIVELIEGVKIVDPAVGSGAFPMGALNKLVFILNKVDPGNELWKQAQLNAADGMPDSNIKIKIKKEIEEYFKSKKPDYWRKLYLIQRCIYGVDVQQIAVEITKLRFFISLLVDEDENDIQPLPNLDFKIMQGNSLLEEYEGIKLFDKKLLTDNGFDKQKQIISVKEKQSVLQREYLKLHRNGQLTVIKQAQLNEELKNLDKQLKGLSKQDNKTEEIAGLFDAQNEAKQKREMLKRLHGEFFETSEKKEKGKLRELIEKMEWGLIEATLKEQNKEAELKKLEKFKKSKSKPFFLWQLNFAEVFEKGGFDVVIANPPYIRQEEIKEYKPLLQKAGYMVYNSTSDLYTYFYELSYNLLAPSRFSCFISSNKWMRAKYGEKLRHFFKTKTMAMKLIDFGGHKVFDATVDTNIMLFQKNEPQKEYQLPYVNIESDFTGDEIDGYVREKQQTIKQDELSDLGWTLANDKVLALKKKIEKIGTPIKDWNVKICFGIKTGFNEALIIDAPTKERLCKEDPKSVEILKPILRGRDIGRYYYRWAGLWLIKIESGWTNENRDKEEPEKFFKKVYPAVYEHLKSMGEKKGKGKGLYKRDDQGDYWWELRDCDYYGEFEKEKIIYPDIAGKLTFAYENENCFLNNTGYFLNVGNKYLLAVINSLLMDFYYKQISSQLGKEALRAFTVFIEQLPIPKIPETEQKPFIDLVDKILAITKDGDYLQNKTKQAKVKEYERQIDQLVYKLYNLTPAEIEIVENSSKK